MPEMDFNTWKNLPPVEDIAYRLRFATALAQSQDWNDYTARFIAANDDDGQMIKAARELFGDLETEERPILAAMLHAADFSRIADELSENMTWWRFSRIGGENATAVALAILRQ